jgi:hypothetical protein
MEKEMTREYPKHEILLAELGSFLQSDKCGPSSYADAVTLLTAGLQFLEGCDHPLDCPRSRDDFDCTCPIHWLQEDIQDWLDRRTKARPNVEATGANCNRHGAIVETGCPDCDLALGRTDSACSRCDGSGSIYSGGLIFNCPVCNTGIAPLTY